MTYIIILILLVLLLLSYSLGLSRVLKITNHLRKKRKCKDLYLTFDDGPSGLTDKLLDLLKKYNIKASFFVVANYAVMYKDIMKKMQDDGHLICLHSLDHKSEALKLPSKTIKDLKKSIDILRKDNIELKYFRAPWGQFNLASLWYLRKMRIRKVIWDTMAEDWKANTTAKIIKEKLLKRVKGGEVICLHDGRGRDNAPLRTIEALEEIIPIWLEKGFVFRTMDDYYE